MALRRTRRCRADALEGRVGRQVSRQPVGAFGQVVAEALHVNKQQNATLVLGHAHQRLPHGQRGDQRPAGCPGIDLIRFDDGGLGPPGSGPSPPAEAFVFDGPGPGRASAEFTPVRVPRLAAGGLAAPQEHAGPQLTRQLPTLQREAPGQRRSGRVVRHAHARHHVGGAAHHAAGAGAEVDVDQRQLVGVGVLAGAQPNGGWWAVAGTLAVVLSSLAYASGNVIGQRSVSGTPGPVLATGAMTTAAVTLLPFAVLHGLQQSRQRIFVLHGVAKTSVVDQVASSVQAPRKIPLTPQTIEHSAANTSSSICLKRPAARSIKAFTGFQKSQNAPLHKFVDISPGHLRGKV